MLCYIPILGIILMSCFSEGGRWSLSEIEYETDSKTVVLSPSVDISAKLDESFVSNAPIIFKNDSVPSISLKFKDLQVLTNIYMFTFHIDI